MSQPFFRTPFATSGDVSAIPNDSQPDGTVSFTDGFGPDYQAATDDPDVLYPERQKINEIFLLITQALQVMQVHGYPDWIAAADNGGSSYSYDINSFVRYNTLVYFSLVNTNTATPGTDDTKWALFGQQTVPVGTVWELDAATLPASWVWANGNTVGDASSNATGRANADTSALFTQIWTDFPNSVRPIKNSDGSSGTRGVSAAADFAAHKALPVADRRGIVACGRDNMGGASAANRITSAGCGIDGMILGASGGAQNVVLVTDNLPVHAHDVGSIATVTAGAHTHTLTAAGTNTTGAHTHTVSNVLTGGGINHLEISQPGGNVSTVTTSSDGNHSHTLTGSTDSSGAHTHTMTGTTATAGNALALVVVQPTAITNFIIKL